MAKATKKKTEKKAKKEKKLSEISNCPACSSDNVKYVEKDDELVCNDCGEVFARLAPEEEEKYEKVSDVI